MTKSKNLFKNISLMFCLVPMLILSLFCLIPKKQYLNVAAADSVDVTYNFNGSDMLYFDVWRNRYSNADLYPILYSNDFTSTNNNVTITPNFNFINHHVTSLSRMEYVHCDMYDEFSSRVDNISFDNTVSKNAFTYFFASTQSEMSSGNYFMVVFKYDVGFTANIVGVSLYVSTTPLIAGEMQGFKYLYCDYIDTNNNHFKIQFYVPSNYVFDTRTYYFKNPDTFNNNEFYNQGYDDGYSSGVNDGNLSGYQDGYNAGEIVGYGNGYNAGLEQSNKYSFNSLIGAVIDAPVSAFTSLLNFELLGINILGLVTGLLSLAVIVLIIKLCMGGR